ncbi:MAG: hypothetical protein IPN29_17915 [Saprospiraceae bacterium]|nr:hypothetical protein [Saprospiraceae bacterium]
MLTLILWVGLISACKKDDSYFVGKAQIETSLDTLLFDTVFTQVGSATRFFKIYNKEDQAVSLEISLANPQSSFRFNADGFKGEGKTTVEVQPKDSIYVFVEVTINPDAPVSASPFIVEDKILIRQGDQSQEVQLISFGQNANYIPSKDGKGTVNLLSCKLGSISWSDPKPYVIYGVLVIDSCELVIPAGTRIYVHGGVVVGKESVYSDGQILVLANGRLTIQGTPENQVVIEGDRLEPDYNDVAGQWGGIRLLAGSMGNRIEGAVIRNSIVGLVVDSAAVLDIAQTEISNNSLYGIYASHAEINGENLLIHSTGSHALSLTYGGSYRFHYTTLSTSINQDESLVLTNYRCTDALCLEPVKVFPIDFTIDNSIISGGSEDEIILSPSSAGDVGNTFKAGFSHCLVRVKNLLKADQFPKFLEECDGCINQKFSDRIFADANKNNYRPDSMSVVLELAVPLPAILQDIAGKMRDGLKPDLGCYEL